MTFTKTRPTTPGFFIWKEEQGGFHSLADVYTTERGLLACIMNGSIRFAEDYDGEWCRLVPVDEIEHAFNEGFAAGVYASRLSHITKKGSFHESRAEAFLSVKGKNK